MSKKMNVAVLFGGRSVEHEISVITALQLIEAVDPEKFSIVPVYIAQSGSWFSGPQLLKKSFYQGLPGCLDQLTEVTLLPRPGVGGLTVIKPLPSLVSRLTGSTTQTIPVDVYIPAFHGQYGEDGCIQGLLEMADVAYASSSVMSSAVAMNKAICKAVAGYHGIPVLPFALANKSAASIDLEALRKKILTTPGLESFPLFVKPCHLGSSIGISRVRDTQELNAALAGVFKYDEVAIIEPCVTSIMEVNISVLDGEQRTASVTEIPVGTEGVLSYEDKYMQPGAGKKGKTSVTGPQGMAGLTRLINPEHLSEEIKSAVTGYALQLAGILGSSGVGRYDFIVDTTSAKIYFNELNPIPGSFSFYLWEKSSPPVIYTHLINRLIKRALDRKIELTSFEKNTGFKAMFK